MKPHLTFTDTNIPRQSVAPRLVEVSGVQSVAAKEVAAIDQVGASSASKIGPAGEKLPSLAEVKQATTELGREMVDNILHGHLDDVDRLTLPARKAVGFVGRNTWRLASWGLALDRTVLALGLSVGFAAPPYAFVGFSGCVMMAGKNTGIKSKNVYGGIGAQSWIVNGGYAQSTDPKSSKGWQGGLAKGPVGISSENKMIPDGPVFTVEVPGATHLVLTRSSVGHGQLYPLLGPMGAGWFFFLKHPALGATFDGAKWIGRVAWNVSKPFVEPWGKPAADKASKIGKTIAKPIVWSGKRFAATAFWKATKEGAKRLGHASGEVAKAGLTKAVGAAAHKINEVYQSPSLKPIALVRQRVEEIRQREDEGLKTPEPAAD